MSVRSDLVGYALKALGVAAVAVGLCGLLLWKGMGCAYVRVAAEVSAADVVSASVAFATLVATIVLAFVVSRFGAQQSRDEAKLRVEKDLAIASTQRIVDRLVDLHALLRQPSGQATYQQALDLTDEAGIALRQLGKLLDLLEYGSLGQTARGLYEGRESDVSRLRNLIEDRLDDLDRPLAAAVRQTVAPFVEDLNAKVLRLLVDINRAPSAAIPEALAKRPRTPKPKA